MVERRIERLKRGNLATQKKGVLGRDLEDRYFSTTGTGGYESRTFQAYFIGRNKAVA